MLSLKIDTALFEHKCHLSKQVDQLVSWGQLHGSNYAIISKSFLIVYLRSSSVSSDLTFLYPS